MSKSMCVLKENITSIRFFILFMKPYLTSLFYINSTAENELRRRKRIARQSAMEDRIREIKRKQRDAEEAPKKRRSLMLSIAAGVGVVVGLVCVIAYAKFG